MSNAVAAVVMSEPAARQWSSRAGGGRRRRGSCRTDGKEGRNKRELLGVDERVDRDRLSRYHDLACARLLQQSMSIVSFYLMATTAGATSLLHSLYEPPTEPEH